MDIGSNWITAEKKQGPAALTNAGKMPGLNADGAYAATNTYPTLKAFAPKGEAPEEDTYGPEIPSCYDNWDGSTKTQPAEGKGTEAEPYLISNGAELAWAVSNATADVYYKLTKNIYLNDVSQVNWSTGKVKEGYTVKSWLVGNSFAGNINGDGYTVHGVYYNAGVTTAQMTQDFADPVGLISNIPNGVTVKLSKLGVDNQC